MDRSCFPWETCPRRALADAFVQTFCCSPRSFGGRCLCDPHIEHLPFDQQLAPEVVLCLLIVRDISSDAMCPPVFGRERAHLVERQLPTLQARLTARLCRKGHLTLAALWLRPLALIDRPANLKREAESTATTSWRRHTSGGKAKALVVRSRGGCFRKLLSHRCSAPFPLNNSLFRPAPIRIYNVGSSPLKTRSRKSLQLQVECTADAHMSSKPLSGLP